MTAAARCGRTDQHNAHRYRTILDRVVDCPGLMLRRPPTGPAGDSSTADHLYDGPALGHCAYCGLRAPEHPVESSRVPPATVVYRAPGSFPPPVRILPDPLPRDRQVPARRPEGMHLELNTDPDPGNVIRWADGTPAEPRPGTRSTVDNVRALHVPGLVHGNEVCIECGRPHPCPTIRVLDGAREGIDP